MLPFTNVIPLLFQEPRAMTAMAKDASTDQNFDYMFKILIIGNSSVGKTSFLFRYADDSFTSAFVSTVGIDFKVKTVFRHEKRVKLQIWVSEMAATKTTRGRVASLHTKAVCCWQIWEETTDLKEQRAHPQSLREGLFDIHSISWMATAILLNFPQMLLSFMISNSISCSFCIHVYVYNNCLRPVAPMTRLKTLTKMFWTQW